MAQTYLYFDVETQGLPLFREPSDDPRQPHLVQLAATLVGDSDFEVQHSMNRIIKPDGWTIPEEVAAVHGITTERALDEGVPEKEVLEEFIGLMEKATHRVAFNSTFDARLIRIAMKRFGIGDQDAWKRFPDTCVMRMATPVCQIPPTGKMMAAGLKHYKNPNLGEAYQIIMGEPLEGAHDAMVDVEATMKLHVMLLLQEQEAQEEGAAHLAAQGA